MSNVAIVGAGQAGTQLALGLLAAGCEVTLVSNRTPDEIATGPVLSSQCMFETALRIERDLHAVGLTRAERTAVLGCLEDPPDGLVESRGVLRREHSL